MLGILGLAAVHLNRPSKALAYLSKSVFPVYIVHFPIQYAISYYLMPVAISAMAKLGILLIGTFVGCFLIYEIVRRIKWIRPLFGMKLERG
jgi:glucan biosynthesis protein C